MHMKQLINQFNLHTRLFNNVIEGIPDGNAVQSMTANTNHIAWLTGHIVSTRYMLAGVLGLSEKEPYPSLFEKGKGMEKDAVYPSMNELTKDWNSVSLKIVEALKNLSAEALDTKMPRPVPIGDTLGDFISFLMHHEAYSIGQIGLYRRYFDLDPMKYN